jgi:hypothetical protein
MYLSLAAYRDPMLQSTIDSAFKNADKPEELTVGCFISVISDSKETSRHLITNDYNGSVRYEVEEAGSIFSVTRARNKSNQWLTKEHKYLLQVDSHSRFLPGWDTQLIDSYERLGMPNALFSTYVPSWFPTPDGEHYREWQDNKTIMFTSYDEGSRARDAFFETYEIVPCQTVEQNPSGSFYKGWHVAGMFQFGPAHYYLKFPQPEWIVFWGEEMYNSCVAFTNGWDVYIPDVMPLRQMFPQDLTEEMNQKFFGNPKGPHKNWRDFGDKWFRAERNSTDLIIDALLNKTTGPGYLGTVRPIEGLYEFIGYNIAELYKRWRDEYREIH